MKRRIIHIDADKCNGCGLCAAACHEGAIEMVDGKAVLTREDYCDGLGDCLPACPTGAITFEEREAPAYDHAAVQAAQAAKRAVQEEPLPCGCPGTLARRLAPRPAANSAPAASSPSALRQWPVQLKLLNPAAEYFDDADLLISADCVAHAFGGFHRELLDGKILVVFCPKLDNSTEEYVEKLAEIFRRHRIRSITVARMEVPCCGGTVAIVEQAMERAGLKIPLSVRIVGIGGDLLS